MTTIRPACAVFVTLLLWLPGIVRADNWPAWRGPNGNGYCNEKNLPNTWSPTENVRWKVKLPDVGNSTPIIWQNKIFLTQARDKGQTRSLMCFERKEGKLLWEKSIEYKEKELTHGTNPFCSASPATDGERVVISHGSAGLFCYDLEGNELWRRDLGLCQHIWGNAASPVIFENLVILNFGPGERTFLLAVDKKKGEDVWKVEIPGGKSGSKGQSEWVGSWSTPSIAKIKDREELIMSWPGEVKAYDPRKGKELWSCKGLEKDKAQDLLVYTSPLVCDTAVVGMAGYGGAAIALKTGGNGDITDTHRLWRHPGNPQRIGSGVIIGEHIYMVNETGTAQCIDLMSGKILWTERVGEGTWSSIVFADDKLYVPNLKGETLVLSAKPKFEILHRNALNERTLSSIAVSDGCLFIRTYEHLWCIGK